MRMSILCHMSRRRNESAVGTQNTLNVSPKHDVVSCSTPPAAQQQNDNNQYASHHDPYDHPHLNALVRGGLRMRQGCR